MSRRPGRQADTDQASPLEEVPQSAARLGRTLAARERRAVERAKQAAADIVHKVEDALPYPNND